MLPAENERNGGDAFFLELGIDSAEAREDRGSTLRCSTGRPVLELGEARQ